MVNVLIRDENGNTLYRTWANAYGGIVQEELPAGEVRSAFEVAGVLEAHLSDSGETVIVTVIPKRDDEDFSDAPWGEQQAQVNRMERATDTDEEKDDDDAAEQERRWAALDASVPCSHTIPGTCDYCQEDTR